MAGRLYLIPSTISNAAPDEVIPQSVKTIINNIQHYIVENERTARRTLIGMGLKTPVNKLTFFILNKYTKPSELPEFLEVTTSDDIGLLSEAGLPAIADPGCDVVLMAHQRNIEVIPLVGPSSVILSMMASGLNGQNFAFNGYLPVKSSDRIRKIKQLERLSQSENQSQIFIETPYRNNQLVADILKTCSNKTLLCIATDITAKEALIKTHTIEQWRKMHFNIHKRPSIFIIHKK